MSLNQSYDELTLYLTRVQNEISRIFHEDVISELSCQNIYDDGNRNEIPQLNGAAFPGIGSSANRAPFSNTNEDLTLYPKTSAENYLLNFALLERAALTGTHIHRPNFFDRNRVSVPNYYLSAPNYYSNFAPEGVAHPDTDNSVHRAYFSDTDEGVVKDPSFHLDTPNYYPNCAPKEETALPKTDSSVHRVHFSDTNEEILLDPNAHLSPSRYYPEFAPKEGDSLLKSCLKNSARSKNYQYLQQNLCPEPFSAMERNYPSREAESNCLFYPTYEDYLQYPQPLTEQNLVLLCDQPSQAEPENYPIDDRHQDLPQADSALQEEDSDNETDKKVLELIQSIKADIQELKEKYEHDDEIERNRYLTQELEEILKLYRSNTIAEKETDDLSDQTSGSSNDSTSMDTVIHNAGNQTSPTASSASLCMTNLSKDSESSSSPCLISSSDADLADISSTSSIDSRYKPSSSWKSSSPQAVLRSKSSSAPVLKNKQPKVNKQARSQSDRHLAEIEAAEACKWLRATGFPQYAQMYEDMQFPVDISTAARDHPRLDEDILNSLYRRLRILNNCVHINQQRIAHADESEDENYALSNNWTFQSDIRRWSRACIDPTAEVDNLRRSKRLAKPEEQLEEANKVPREHGRRAASARFRRRREGVVISDSGAKLLDSLSEQLSGISVTSSLSSVTDSELTPNVYNRLWKKPSEEFDRNETVDDRFNSEFVSGDDENVPYCKFSSHQLGQLERLAMLKLTSYIEKYCPTHRTGWTWGVPKSLIRKMKNPAYRDKSVFGVPIQLTLQRTGHTLPRNIETALEWLQENAVDQVGLFRKSGVKSRIQTLRNTVESSTEMITYEDQQPYDVADMVKQYFRELPEALLTNKLSETFKLIFQYVPAEQRMDAVLCGIFLMPDEHIEVLQTLVNFLILIAKHSEENQMNESNLATCFAPSLFQYAPTSKGSLGSPHPKDLAENRAAHDCLQFFLENHHQLFTIPRKLINQWYSTEMKEWKLLDLNELGADMGGWREYLKECEQAHLKEVKDKSRGWTLLPNLQNPKVEVYFKKIDDGLSVRVWKVITDIDAPPSEVMHRILRERHIWDLELQSAKIVMQLDKNAEIFQYGRTRMASLPIEEYCVVRLWKSDLPRGSCLIVETSIEHEDVVHIPDSIKAIVHASRYYIEPCGSGRSRLYHICRTDTMGRKPEYYYKNYGHIVGFFISNIQQSFVQQTSGPESKV